ncbi:MAG: hypothetical protein OER80_11345 [Gammaproteobacteria bacterium]|nr:hypothetical protein [Gammaproteobacteria bacterium]MDH3766958.1 hypothetical protein [Gammaproteobacteria bacterium]
MSDKPGNKADAWLEDESTVSRAYRELQNTEPPAHVSDHILAEARRAAASQDSTVIRVQHWRKWTMPAALAATVVFAVPLVVRVFTSVPTDFETPTVTMTDMKTEAEVEVGEKLDTNAGERSTRAVMPADELLKSLNAPQQATLQPDAAGAPVARESFSADEPAVKAASGLAAPQAQSVEETLAGDDEYAATPPARIEQSELRDSRSETANRENADDDYAATPQARSDQSELRDSGSETANWEDADEAKLYAVESTAEIVQQEPPGRPEPVAAEGFRVNRSRSALTSTLAQARADREQDTTTKSSRLSSFRTDPDQILETIAKLHEQGYVLTARRKLGSFLTQYPDYELPDDYPMQASDAIFGSSSAIDTQEIVPEAETWLRDIAQMAQRGEIDQARIQLAEFFQIYPDYPLPVEFPLTRDDAAPIER